MVCGPAPVAAWTMRGPDCKARVAGRGRRRDTARVVARALLPSLSRHERSVLAATCLSSLGSFYSMAVSGFALPQIQQGLAVAEDEVSGLFALLRFGTLFSLGLAMLADRVGRRRLLILSVAGCALCNLATAFAPTGLAWALLQLAARFFIGGQLLLAGVVVSEELEARNRGTGLGILTAVGGLGGALTLLVYAFVDQIPYGWRSLYAVGGLGVALVPWLVRSLGETRRFVDRAAQEPRPSVDPHDPDRPAVPAPPAAGLWQPLRELASQQGWRLAALVGAVLPVTMILEPGSVFPSKHLQGALGFAPPQVSLLMAVCGAGTPLGNMLAGAASDRLGRRPVTIAFSLLLSASVGLFYNAEGLVPVAIGLGGLFVGIGAIQVLHTALATELFATGFRSTAAGVREAVGTIGATAGLALVGMLYGSTGSNAASITWILALTPIAPLVLLGLPETARRELEEI